MSPISAMGCSRNWHRTDIKEFNRSGLESNMRSMTCYEIPQHNQIQLLHLSFSLGCTPHDPVCTISHLIFFNVGTYFCVMLFKHHFYKCFIIIIQDFTFTQPSLQLIKTFSAIFLLLGNIGFSVLNGKGIS